VGYSSVADNMGLS